MTYLSLFDKLKVLFNTMFDFKGILIFSILMIAFTVLYLLKKLSVKRYTIGISLSLILVFLISILTNFKVLSNTFDNFATIFFGGIYFPSIYLYISTLTIVLMVFLVSVINVKIKKVYKIITKIMFVLNSIMFVLILNIIAKNKIDIFSVNSLYTNTNLVVMLEISMSLFLIWLAALAIAYVTNCICDRITKKKIVLSDEKIKIPVEEVNTVNDDMVTSKEEANTVKNNIVTPIEISIDVNKKDKKEIKETTYSVKKTNLNKKYSYRFKVKGKMLGKVKKDSSIKNNFTFDDILNGKIPVSYYHSNSHTEEYSISNPQEIYEGNYNNAKLNIENSTISEAINLEEANVQEKVSILSSVEDMTKEIKNNRIKENLINNTISLNDLVDNDTLEEVKVIDEISDIVKESNNYTVDDYKKMIKMLNGLKAHSVNSNISVDDAVAISLISNYSIDDCLKFKDILESYLN